jgi:perosamine synthetase
MSTPAGGGGGYRVPYSRVGTQITERELAVVRSVLKSGMSLSQGIWRQRFEDAFRAEIGTRYAFTVTSGTVALELAIHLLDLEAGDEVITTPQTYQATVQPLLNYDVEVRFADISAETANIDPDSIAKLITNRTRAIILVHYGGLTADMNRIMGIADDHDLLVIEDAAHALGGMYYGKRPGSIGHIGCFSFHSSKNITTLGEGGMLTFNRPSWAERLQRLRGNEADAVFVPCSHRFGNSTRPAPGALYPGSAYTHDCIKFRRAGTNATLSEPACAFGLIQLSRLPELVARRQVIAARLAEVLARFDGVRIPWVPPGIEHPYHLFTFFIEPSSGIDRDDVIDSLAAEGVETYLRYFPLHLLPEWRGLGHGYGECPVAERRWFENHMNLPCHPSLSDDQVDHLAAALFRALRAGYRGRPR